MIKKVQEGYDVVIASRFEKGGGQKGVSTYRSFISRGANLFMKLFFPIKGINEYSCGYRAYSSKIIRLAINEFVNSFMSNSLCRVLSSIAGLFNLATFSINSF